MANIILDKSTLATPLVAVNEAMKGYETKNVRFGSDAIMPVYSSPKKTGNLPTYKRGEALMVPSQERNPGDPYPRTSFTIGGKTFACREFGHEVPVPEEIEKELGFDLALGLSVKAAFQLKLRRELRMANTLFNTSLFTGADLYTDVATTWATSATCTPIDDIEAAKEKILQGTGQMANTVLMSHANLLLCKKAAQLVTADIIRTYPDAGKPADSDAFLAYLAERFGVKQVIVPTAVYNSTNNPDSPTITPVWSSSYVLVASVAEPMNSSDIAAEGLGRSVAWEDDGGVELSEIYYSEERRSNIVRVRHSLAEFIIDVHYGHLLKVD